MSYLKKAVSPRFVAKQKEEPKEVDLLLESIRQRVTLDLLELPITGMCLPTHGSLWRWCN
jgi:hypothetical protein